MRSSARLTLLASVLALAVTTQAPAQSGTKPTNQPAAESSAAKNDPGSSGTKADDRAKVHSSDKDVMPLKVGEAVPSIQGLKNAKGENVNLPQATKGKTSVLVFYRGGWCPYCNVHLGELAKVQPELAANDVQLLAFSPDSPETLKKYNEEKDLPYMLVSDNEHKAMKAFGIAYAVDAHTQGKLKDYGIDLVEASENPEQVLPVPAVFVVDRQGKIIFAHAEADYKKRLSGAEVLQAAGLHGDHAGSAAKQETGSAAKESSNGSATKPDNHAHDEHGSGSK